MAIGAFVGGRIADRVRSPLRMYGILELLLVVVVRPDASVIRVDPRGLPVDLSEHRGHADARPRPAGAGGPRLGSRDGDDGRHLPGTRPSFRARRSPERGVRSPLFREHRRRGHRNAGRGPRAHRVVGAIGRVARRGNVLRDRGSDRPLAVACRCPGDSSRGDPCVERPDAPPVDRPRAGDRIPVRPDLARLPGDLDPTPHIGNRRLHVRVHGRPRPIPRRDRDRRRPVHLAQVTDRQPASTPGRGAGGGRRTGHARAALDHRVATAARSRRSTRDPSAPSWSRPSS